MRLRLNPTAPLISALLAVLTALLFFTLFCLFILAGARHEHQQAGQRALDKFDEVFSEVNAVADSLISLHRDSCDINNLRDMQRALFDASYMKDIGFFIDNKLACATSTGELSKPIKIAAPDYVDAQHRAFWLHSRIILFKHKTPHYALIVKIGDYNFVLELKAILANTLTQQNQWQLLYTPAANKAPVTLAGNPHLFEQSVQHPHSLLSSATLFSDCSSRYPNYCIVVRQPFAAVIARNSTLLMVAFIVSLIAATAALMALNIIRKRQKSVPYRIRQGLKNKAFYWQLQPIVDLQSDNIIGAEVLARFRDQYGSLAPDQFIEVVRELGMAPDFTLAMFNTVLPALENETALAKGFRVSFNIFPHTLIDADTIKALARLPLFNQSRFMLVLEITESEYIDQAQAQANLRYLRQMGLGIAIDDFGTGYANLGQLMKIDSDLIKIDRSFVMDMEENSIRSSLIPHIISIARQLGVRVVAEGVENQAQCQALKKLGVHYGQGWLFGKPMPVSQLAQQVAMQHKATDKTAINA
ncbi:EAL domain-containing protein [Gallaecimonas mangrovi]|uniref:EAL domain-containing protein n=1 Tax=Gallaecimonas mangrovi TaxID=2291597 RepID=UPI000E202063|nr:EAL domain-containing protein [Gallaecimonas mangrovi]